ncbi:MAG TPA: BTAD domain-containing putative transcriptional regulator [Candidatus Limnocylindrales bacterium]|nr:BTAD domain-containing putative transcriptional regulator [Candidatus Limnocylindrales bacterium]
MEFAVLGPLDVRDAGASVAIPPGGAGALLAHLLIRPNRVISAEELIDAIWGEDAPRTARNVLQAHVAHLRRVLRAGGPGAAERLETRGAGYRIRVEAGEFDADVFAAEVTEVRRRQRANPVAAADLLRHALGLWRGSAFEDVDIRAGSDSGVIDRLEDFRLGALETRSELDLRLGRVADVIGDLERLVAEHPFRERFHGLLMLALYRAGRQADALDAYHRARAVLDEELGVEPGPELRALQLAILRQDRELMADDSRIGALVNGDDDGTGADEATDGRPHATAVPNNLPVELTPFIGRDRELAGLLALLGEERLVTVTGVGGTGKTRFARQAASLALDSFPGGAWFIDLAPVPDGDRILPTLAAAVGVPEQGGRSLFDTVVGAVGQSRLLLVIDNCEHVIDASARLIDGMLRAVPGLVVLATSREPLRLSSEVLLRLVPLPVSAADGLPRAELLATDAVRLFLDRAGRVRSIDQLSDADVATIAQICRRLDGLPLALEMAAARLRVLSPSDILDRLEDRFSLLTDGGRIAAERHQTIRATLDWSHDMLDEAERATLRRMSSFVSAVPAAAVEGICAGEGVGDALDSAMRLADRSLVVANVGADGRTRFGLLDTVRDYGRVHLRASGEETTTLLRHVGWWTSIAERAYALRFADPDGQAAELEAVLGEIRVALDRAHALAPAGETHLAGLLGWFWAAHSHLVEGRVLLDRALSVDGADEVDRARALAARGSIASFQGDGTAADDLAAALALWRGRGDRVEECATLDTRGWARFFSGDVDGAGSDFEAGLLIATEVGDSALVRRTSAGLCQILVARHDVERARPLAEEILRIASDDIRTAHFGHHFLADCDLMSADCVPARDGYRRSLVLAERMQDGLEVALEIEGVGMASAGCGEPELALRLGGAAAAILERLEVDVDVPFWAAFEKLWFGLAREALGPAADAAWDAGRTMSMADAIREALAAAPVPA